MRLFIAAQDIGSITVGLGDAHGMHMERTLTASPERYLAAIDEAFAAWGIVPSDIRSVLVVTGPGSFTASRVSTTIANALAFSQGVPVIGVENPNHLPLRDLLAGEGPQAGPCVTPTYGRPPEITRPRTGRGDNAAD